MASKGEKSVPENTIGWKEPNEVVGKKGGVRGFSQVTKV